MTKDEKVKHYMELAKRNGVEAVIRFLVEVIEGEESRRATQAKPTEHLP